MPAPPLTLAAIRQPALLYDADGRIVEANGPADALAGRPLAGRSAADALGIFGIRSPDGALFEPSDLPATRVLAGGEAVDVPFTVTAADGRTVHVLATASPLRDGAEIVGALSIWQDVSALEAARARAETATADLEEQREELRQQGDELVRAMARLDRQRGLLDAILATLPHRVSLWDRDHRLAWANERFATGHGEPREALAGRHWSELGYDPAVVGPFGEDTRRSTSAGTPFSREVEIAGPTGGQWLAVTALPIFGDSVLVISEDVTDRKQAEDALRRSLERLGVAQAAARCGFWDWDAVADELTWSPELFDLLDLAPAEEMTFAAWLALVHPEDREAAMAAVDRSVDERVPLELEYRAVLPSGQVRWLSTLGDTTYDAEGRLLRMAGICVDVTERRRAEDALRESEEKYRSLAELSPDGIVVHRGGTILYANPAVARIMGLEPEALIGAGILDHIHPEDRASTESRTEMVQDGGLTAPFRELRLLVDGGVVYAETAGAPVHWEGAPAVQVIVRDVTERKRAGAALRESEERLRLARACAGIGIWEWQYPVMPVPPGTWSSTTSRTRSCGSTTGAVSHPGDLERVEGERDAALARREPFELEFRYDAESGTVRWMRVLGGGVFDEAGRLVRILGVNMDITARSGPARSCGSGSRPCRGSSGPPRSASAWSRTGSSPRPTSSSAG
jgi:PAS domain S-box-containing protein